MDAARILRSGVFKMLVFLLGTIGNAGAQWTYRAAPPPLIRTITVFANSPVSGTHTIIASTVTDGMYKGTDTGTTVTWQKINAGIPVIQMRTHATVSATDFYAATEGAGVFKTVDGGANWTAVNGSGATALGCLDIRSIAIPVTTAPRTLLVSTWCRNGSGVYRSLDDGATWTRLGPVAGNLGSIPADMQSNALTRIGSGASTIYFLSTANYGIFKSADDGATWATANNGITGSNAFNVSFSGTPATNSNDLLAYIHGSGVYRSTNSGASWVLSNTGLPAGFAGLGGINRDTLQTLYIGLDKQGLYKTTDGGVTWAAWGNTASDSDAKYSRGITPVGAVPGLYYLATLEGIVKTTNSGVNLQTAGNMEGGRVNAITHDRDSPKIAFVATKDPLKISDIYGDYNSPALISPIDTGVTGATNDGVVYQDRLAPTTLYVVTNNRGIFKSTNGGTSFTAINTGLPNMIGQTNRLSIDPTNSQNLYLGLNDEGGVYKSTNGGANWTISSAGLLTPKAMSVNFVTVDPNNATIVWAATDAGVYKSIDSGANWLQKYSAVDGAGSVLGSSILRVRPGNSNEIYVANNHVNANGTLAPSSGLQMSIDGGTSWNNILPNQRVSQVRVTAGGDIYAGVSAQVGNPAVYLSTNGGVSFVPYATNLQGSDIRGFGVGADDSVLISLSLENGLYTNDAGQTPILRVNKVGAGTVTSVPAGINCGDICAATVTVGSLITLTAAPSSGATFAGWSGGGCSGTGSCAVTVNLATTVVATFTNSTFSLVAVKSRKTHGAFGAFDIPIDTAALVNGAVTVEPRVIGAGHKVVFQFSGAVTSVGAVSAQDVNLATVGTTTYQISGNDVIVTLTGAPNNQRVKVSLTNVVSGVSSINVGASLGILAGDINNSRSVTATDTSGVKARSGQTTSPANFRYDLNASGSVNAADISAVKTRSGQVLN